MDSWIGIAGVMRSILGIDTASPEGSVALEIDGATAGIETLAPGGHSSGLSAAAKRLLAARGLGFDSLSGIAVSEGPGSFTGLRIGLAWAKGAALARPLGLALVSAHDAAAHAHRDQPARFATVTQGERGFVLAALWEPGPSSTLAWGPEAAPEDDFLDALRDAAGGEDVAVATPSDALSEAVLDLGGTVLPRRPLAGAVAALGDRALQEGRGADLAGAAPAYGRAPNARKPGKGPIRIAPMSIARIGEIVAIERLVFSDPWSPEMFRSELELGGGTYARAAERDGRVLGYLCAVLVADEAHLGNLAVHPGEQRSGVGQLLLDDLLRAATRHGVARLTLEVRESNEIARNFYRKNEFIDVAIRKNYYRSPVEDAIVMLRGLPGDNRG